MGREQCLQVDAAEITAAADPDDGRLRAMWCQVLMLAILDYWFARGRAFFEAREWIFYGCTSLPNSFENVARFLDFNPRGLRYAIARRRSEFQDDPDKATAVLSQLRGQGDGARRSDVMIETRDAL